MALGETMGFHSEDLDALAVCQRALADLRKRNTQLETTVRQAVANNDAARIAQRQAGRGAGGG